MKVQILEAWFRRMCKRFRSRPQKRMTMRLEAPLEDALDEVIEANLQPI